MRASTAITCLALAAFLSTPVIAAGWADRGEYDLVMSIRSEASAQKRIELLDQWQAKYPQSDFRQARRELYLSAYASMGDSARMLKTAREMLNEQPTNFVGVYWCALLAPEVRNAPADVLDAGEKSAKQLSAGLDTYFASSAKPAATSDAEWAKWRAIAALIARRTLGWVAWQRGDLDAASKEFHAYLDQSPASAEITAWLGIVSSQQKEPEKQVGALWYLERAALLRGEGSLPSDQLRVMGALADDVYTAYHGDKDGLDDLKTAAVAGANPPADFHVETAAAVAARKADEELTRTNPELAAWVHMRRQLEAADGDKYLDQLRSTPMPKLKGTVVRAAPENKPSEIVLGMSQPTAEELIIHLSQPFPNAAPAGAEIEFEGGMAQSLVKEPFTLTVAVDRDKITGWPEPPSRRGK
jgi:hypothetical protein